MNPREEMESAIRQKVSEVWGHMLLNGDTPLADAVIELLRGRGLFALADAIEAGDYGPEDVRTIGGML